MDSEYSDITFKYQCLCTTSYTMPVSKQTAIAHVCLSVSIRIMQIRGNEIQNFCIIYIKLKVCHFQFMHITRKHTQYTLTVSATLLPYMLSVYNAMNVKGKLCGNGVTTIWYLYMSLAMVYWSVGGNCGFIIQIAYERVSLISFDHFEFYERFSLKVKALCSSLACTYVHIWVLMHMFQNWLINHFLSAFWCCLCKLHEKVE